MYICRHVKYPLLLSDFNETGIFLDRFSKNPQVPNFMKILPLGAKLLHADGQTDEPKLIVVFRNSANAPRNGSSYKRISTQNEI